MSQCADTQSTAFGLGTGILGLATYAILFWVEAGTPYEPAPRPRAADLWKSAAQISRLSSARAGSASRLRSTLAQGRCWRGA